MKHQLFWLFLLISASGCREVDVRVFRGVEDSSKAIQTAMDRKPSLPQFRELLATYSSALAVAAGQAKAPQERRLLEEYQAALKGLTDIVLAWEERDARHAELLPIRDELAARLKQEYDLPVNTNEPPSIYATEAIEAAWGEARKHLKSATQALAQ